MASSPRAKSAPDELGGPTQLRPQLIASRLFAIARLMNKSGNIVYAREFGLTEVEWGTLMVIGDNAPLSLLSLIHI